MMAFEHNSTTPEAARNAKGVKAYQRPVLRDLGAVAVLTQGGGGSGCDGMNPSMDNGAPCQGL